MNNKILTLHAWGLSIPEIEEFILEGGFREVHFYWSLEWEWILTPATYRYLIDNNIMIRVITCGVDRKWLYRKLVKHGFSHNLIKVDVWPMFWFLRANNSLIDEDNKLYQNIDVNQFDFKYPFLTFNGRHNWHRTRLIDMLYHYGYLDKGVVTYHQEYKGPSDTLDWEFYHGAPIRIDDGFDSHHSSYSFNNKFLNSFLHIPTETTLITPIISEKTAIPILCRLPFLTLGPQHYHKQLKSLGFELYDEIFDYSFDDEPNNDLRIKKLLINVKFVIDNSHRLNDLYKQILPKIMRNYQLAMKHVTSYSLLPNMIKDRFKSYTSPDVSITSGDHEFVRLSRFFTDKQLPAPTVPLTIMKQHYDLWHNFNFDTIIQDLSKYNIRKVVIMGENEWDPWVTDKAVDALNSKDSTLIYVTGAYDKDRAYKQLKELGLKKVQVDNWPTFWINYSDMSVDHDTIRLPDAGNFKHPFICLNNRGHLHRAHVIDQMAKEDLLDKGVVSWHDFLHEADNFDFKYFDKRVIKLSDNFDTLLDSFLIPDEFHESLFHFVTECSYQTIMLSEKTAIPIMAKKPFICMGAVNYHKFLQDLGFELYDEIFDYSFDSVEDIEERATKFVKNMKIASKLTNFSKIYEMLKPKIQRNYDNFYRIRDDLNYFPSEAMRIIENTPEDKNLHSTPAQSKYANLTDRMKGNR